MEMRTRTFGTDFQIRAEGDELYIEGYFAVFDKPYVMFDDNYETVAPGAFADTLNGDIRCLINHDTRLVLGRTKSKTLELREDEFGLWGRVLINPNDQDAMNLYERVKRGDVSQCSFGFDILAEETEFLENGVLHWIIKSVRLYEVSVVTFPAYEDTGVVARQEDYKNIIERKNELWRAEMTKKLKGE